jgi:hypothetical protein
MLAGVVIPNENLRSDNDQCSYHYYGMILGYTGMNTNCGGLAVYKGISSTPRI